MSSTLALSSISSPSSQLLFAHFTLLNFGSFFWGHFCLWQKPGFSQFRVLRAPYFALQSTPSALLQTLVRAGSQGRKLFVQWFVFCTFISNIHHSTSPQYLLGLSVRPGLLLLTELLLLPSYCLYRLCFLLFQVQGFLLLFQQTLQ